MDEHSDTVEQAITVSLAPAKAFRLFAEDLSSWWPKEYTWSQSELDAIFFERKAGGMCTEIGPQGFHIDWGRVLAWEPPQRLVFTWQISFYRVPQPSPHKASEVEVRFSEASGGATRVLLTHRNLRKHGERVQQYRDAMASEYGWPLILRRYAEAADALRSS